MSATRKRVKEMRSRGMSVREIALILHISTQAVYKHIAALDAAKTKKEAAV